MKQIKTIEPVKNFGVTGFKVTFSILDLYKLQQLALELRQISHQPNLEGKYTTLDDVADVINGLFKATIGETNENWDFLATEEESV